MSADRSWTDESGLRVPGWDQVGDGGRLRAEANTDRFVDPLGAPVVESAPLVLTDVNGDFILQARFHVELASTFDAVGLFVFGDRTTWAKHVFERSPQEEDTFVTVVTNVVSDDCNGPALNLREGAWLRIARVGNVYAFHDSLDGRQWRMRRLFTLGEASAHRVGLTIQSPFGPGLEAEVSDLSLRANTLADVRSGA